MLNSHKSRWMRAGIAGIAAAGALTLAACSGGPAGAGGDAAADADPLKVALITHQPPGDTWFDIVRTGAETASERNNIDLLYTSDPDAGRQAQLIEQAIDQDVDGIVVTLAKPDAMASAVEKAVAAGIPVIGINGGEDVYQDMGVIAHYGQNEMAAGEALGEQLNEQGATRAICLIQVQGQIGLEHRCQGMKDTFEGEAEVLYVEGTDMSSVASTITSKLQTNPDIDFVITLGAPFAITALDAVETAGSDATVGTVDLNADVFKAMQDGKIPFAVDQQPWMQGHMGVQGIRNYYDGGYKLGGGQPVPTGPTVITTENLDSVAAQFENNDDNAEDSE